ncbi:unnamed protein product [Penicillium camemberti]|uniref:Str. FM013 n=1 Tax=Penicillium camemberti (strain FM 013) TaxID=1429867 RepID=A0A0G4PA33_PENC3|nr:unnamed protein product [Penicillium camemberti]
MDHIIPNGPMLHRDAQNHLWPTELDVSCLSTLGHPRNLGKCFRLYRPTSTFGIVQSAIQAPEAALGDVDEPFLLMRRRTGHRRVIREMTLKAGSDSNSTSLTSNLFTRRAHTNKLGHLSLKTGENIKDAPASRSDQSSLPLPSFLRQYATHRTRQSSKLEAGVNCMTEEAGRQPGGLMCTPGQARRILAVLFGRSCSTMETLLLLF